MVDVVAPIGGPVNYELEKDHEEAAGAWVSPFFDMPRMVGQRAYS